MRPQRRLTIAAILSFCCLPFVGCDIGFQDAGDPANLAIPDGIDPKNPKVERTTYSVDFSGVRLIRLEIPTGRIAISQSADGSSSLKVTETILANGHSDETLARFLNASFISAQRSFVDASRLDIKAHVVGELPTKDISFDIRLIIPISAGIEVFAVNAPVEIISLAGNVEIQTGGGEVYLDRVFGSVVARTSRHAIEIRDVTGDVQVTTEDAPITLQLTPLPGIAVTATTTNAPIHMTMARSTATTLDLAAEGGAVSADLTGFTLSDIAFGPNFLRAVLNGGGGRIEARTTGATISFIGM